MCLPHEMVARLDASGRGVAALFEAIDHYKGEHLRRENRRLLDLERRARGGDESARKDLNGALAERAQGRGTTVPEELSRLLATGQAKPATVAATTRPSITDRIKSQE